MPTIIPVSLEYLAIGGSDRSGVLAHYCCHTIQLWYIGTT